MVKVKLEKNIESSLPDDKVKRKLKLKKRLRSLVKTESKIIICKNNEIEEIKKVIPTGYKWKSVALTVIILIASFFLSKLSISSCGFWATYENNYNKIVHGDEKWCYLKLDNSLIVERLKERVIGQMDAIRLIEASLALANREKIIQMAFTGAVGVGKTLTANIVMENFQWQENVISLIFDINFQLDLKDEEAYASDYELVVTKLSDCGYNLIVIDDLNSEDPTMIRRITELERRLHRVAKQNIFKIVLIVIFKRSTEDVTLEQKLSNFVLVEFHPFTEEMFQRCIEVHEELHNVKLTSKDKDELKFINFTNSGCKTLAKKLDLIRKK